MSDLYIELLVKKKRTATDTILKTLLIALTVIAFLAGLLITPLALIVFVGLLVLDYFKLPGFDLEYEYLYVNGELDIDKIMSKQKRKRVGSFDMKNVEMVAPVKSHELDYYRNGKVKVVDYSSGEENANVYAMLVKDDKEQKMVLFEPNQAILDDMRRIAPRAVKLY
ncbi:MAG TPA: hypothetical protein IAB26_01530 [Candidatus Limivivens merdigallinarum]|uniref:Uncharacterized protein n=1 Tax=Candidatus Limivivens merdigallinarum TaxID=2840859 RepID=A0A9D0ZUT0_9FIRM|nr:hypothetical protein [Candidatus Limivivens merdigallinarum]